LPILLDGSFAFGWDIGVPSAVPNPKGSRRLRIVEGETDQESEKVAAGETEKNESDGKRKVGRGKEERRAGESLGY